MKARSVTVEIPLKDEEVAKAIFLALKPETEKNDFRCRVTVSRKRKHLTLKFDADDTAPLRAAFNAHLRYVSCSNRVLSSITDG